MNNNNNNIKIMCEAFEEVSLKYANDTASVTILKEFRLGLGKIPYSNFSGSDTTDRVQKLISKNSKTQDTILGYYINIRLCFLLNGGDWDDLVSDFNTISTVIGKDTSFSNKFENYNVNNFKNTDFVIVMSLISIFIGVII